MQATTPRRTPRWQQAGGVLTLVAVLVGGLLVLAKGPQGPAVSRAAATQAPPAATPAELTSIVEGGAHDPATRAPEATRLITAPNARQLLAARSPD